MKTIVFISCLLLGLVCGDSTTDSTKPATATDSTKPATTTDSTKPATHEQTTQLVTTTLSPANISDATVNTYKYNTTDNTTCLIVTLQAYFNQSGRITNVSNDAVAIHSLSSCGSMTVKFGNNYAFTLTFQNNSKMYWLQQVEANIGSGDDNATGLSVGNSTLKASYKCDTGFTVTLSHNVTMVATNVQFQAFEVPSNKYDTAQICTADIGNNIIIPIAIGCALVGLIVIVLIAYMIGRRQVKHRYEAM